MRVSVVAGLAAATLLCPALARAQDDAAAEGSRAGEIAALKAEVERLRGSAPSQGVAMTQVAYNFSNPVVRGRGA